MKVSLSQFSILPVTLKLVPCMTTTSGQDCSTPTLHRLNQFSNIISWYYSPFLLQHLAELTEGLKWMLTLEHMFIQMVTKMFNRIQIRRFGRPWYNIDVILLKVVHCYTRCVWPSIVLLEYPPLSVNYVHEMRLENFVSVPHIRQIAQGMHEFCFAII